MDTPTHGLAGALLTRSLTQRPGARAALWIGFLASMLPDADSLFLSDRLDYLRLHRGWSHSFVYLPLLALGVAAIARLVFRRGRFLDLWIFAAAGIASHIFLDWITSFGTMFFTPISRTRYSLDWVFIVDLFFTGIGLVALLLSIIFPAAYRGGFSRPRRLPGILRDPARARPRGLAPDRPGASRRARGRPAPASFSLPVARALGPWGRGPRVLLRHRPVRESRAGAAHPGEAFGGASTASGFLPASGAGADSHL
jgi:membrane-bound metal-dependent hydrolase YbcI (DUF457 family)